MVSGNNRNIKNRYLKRHGKVKSMTVCIAAICDRIVEADGKIIRPKIVLCADRLVSAGIQYEGGQSKIRKLTENCFVLQSSEDSTLSDLVLENVQAKLASNSNIVKIKDIAKVISDECVALREETLRREVLSNYNLIKVVLNEKAENLAGIAAQAIQEYAYPQFDFLVAGIELPAEACIYTVNQNGEVRPQHDSNGFATIGGGGGMAFLELTKYTYAREVPMVEALPRVYFAKKAAERVQGVGRWTDLLVLYFAQDLTTKQYVPVVLSFTTKEYFEKFEAILARIRESEAKELATIYQEIWNTLKQKADEENLSKEAKP
jgi:hypothetical protein